MEYIRASCFSQSGLKEVTFLGMLKEIYWKAFRDCFSLRVVWVDECCRSYVRKYMKNDVMVLPTKALIGDTLLRDLRQLSEVVIPEGVEKIRGHWFSYSDIESVTVSRSVQVIEEYAFYGCKNLKEVVFEEGSRLEKIGNSSFARTNLKEITLPKTLKEIG